MRAKAKVRAAPVAGHLDPLSSPAPSVSTKVEYLRPLTRIRPGERFPSFDHGEAAMVRSGALIAELITTTGSSLPLARFVEGDVAPSLARLSTPAFSLRYRSEEVTQIAWLRSGDVAPAAREQEARARDALLFASMQQITILTCLPASYRLYVELLRCASLSGNSCFDLPTHTELAARTCTTRETISREISLLRRHGILSQGKSAQLLNTHDLLRRIARSLQLDDEADVWKSIGVAPLGSVDVIHAHQCCGGNRPSTDLH